MNTATSHHLHHHQHHHLSESLSLIPAITSLLQSLNPKNPKTHQNPDPSILNQFSPHLTPQLIIQVVKNQTNPFHSLFFFNWASSKYSPSHFCFISVTDKLLSHNLFSLAAQTLKTHDRFSDFMVGKFIKAHGDLGHLRSAVTLFRQVKEREFGQSGCLFSFNSLLGVLVKANKIKHAWGYFGHFVIKACAVCPDASTYTPMIKALCRVGLVEDAKKLFDEMGCGRTLVSYNVVIDGLCKKGLLDEARRILEEMVLEGDCLPNMVSYTSLMDGYFKKGEVGNAMRCFDEMVGRFDCVPNAVTYNVLINGLCLNGRVDEAKRMMSRMRLSGVRDDVSTHTSLLKGYCIAGRSDEAIEHFKEMVSRGMNLDKMSYGVIVHEYCNLGRLDEAIASLNGMRARGVVPSVASFNVVFRSLVKLQQYDKAIRLLKQMSRMSCTPNSLSYREVIFGLLGSKGRMRDVEMLVDDMIKDGYSLDTTLYSSLIKAYCENGDTSKAVSLFDEMIGENLVISIECFKVFVAEMCSRGLMREVEAVCSKMIHSCPVVDVQTYENVLNESLCGS